MQKHRRTVGHPMSCRTRSGTIVTRLDTIDALGDDGFNGHPLSFQIHEDLAHVVVEEGIHSSTMPELLGLTRNRDSSTCMAST